MCGIVGFSGSFSKNQLIDSLEQIKHRGPDDFGVMYDKENSVGFGHSRLSIIDLSKLGHQPMFAENSDISIVFNGEIYNFENLKIDLEKQGVSFKSNSDTEVILKMYIFYGVDMVEMLDGIFSFAIYDKRIDEIILVRDHMGIKPLYIIESESGVAFCSEIKGLLSYITTPVELDKNAIHRYMTYLYCPGENTPIKNIKKVEPGYIYRIKEGKITAKSSWFVLPQRKFKANKIKNKNNAIKKVRAALQNAVKKQLISDVPVGCFLSGGLDSSAVVSFAKKYNKNIRCFTIEAVGGNDKGDTDDLPYAQKVAKHLDVDLDIVKIDSKNLIGNLEDMIWRLDEPLADPAAFNVYHICKLAKDKGYKVLLSGAGGDDLFTGYRRHLAIKYDKFWNWAPKSILNAIEFLVKQLDQTSPIGYKTSKLFSDAALKGDEKIVKYFSWATQEKIFNIYSNSMKSFIIDNELKNPLLDYLSFNDKKLTQLESMLTLEQRFFLTDHNLNYTDKMSMATGVEVRVPFLDKNLLNLASIIPDKYKHYGFEAKWVLKKAMEAELPNDIIYRPKTGFGAPLRRWIRNDLKEAISKYLSKDRIENRGIFNYESVQRLIEENATGKYDGSHLIFSILTMEIWCTKFFDKLPNVNQGRSN